MDNLKTELNSLVGVHHAKKAEEARIAKETQVKLAAENRRRVLDNCMKYELPSLKDSMRKAAAIGEDYIIHKLGRIGNDTFTDERANMIEQSLRADGITHIIRQREQIRTPYLDDIDTHLQMEIHW